MNSIHPGLEVTWLGHSGFLVKTPGGKVIALDPWFGNPKCPEIAKDQEKIDLILISHGHGDHSGEAAELSKKYGAKVIAIHELAEYLGSKGASAMGMGKGGTVKVEGLEVTMVHAQHSSSIDEGTPAIYAGEPAGFVVKCEDGFTFYFSGDTGVFGDMALIAELYKPELAFLCIGDHYTMGPREAAVAIRLLNVKKVVPMHWGTFGVLSGTPDALREQAAHISGLRVYDIQPGETI